MGGWVANTAGHCAFSSHFSIEAEDPHCVILLGYFLNNLTYEKFVRLVLNNVDEEATSKILECLNEIRDDSSDKGYKLKRRKMEQDCPAPSIVSSPEGYRTNKVTKNFYNHRMSRHGLPVTVQVKEFAEFVDVNLSSEPVEAKYLHVAVKLMVQMSAVYKHESSRLGEIYSVLSSLFQLEQVEVPQVFKTDLSVKVKNIVCMNVEVKNEIGSSNKSPNLQQTVYYLKIRQMDGKNHPMLLLTIAGCEYFQVFGAVWWSDGICVDPLTDPLSLLFVPDRAEKDSEKVARVLHAMERTIVRLPDAKSDRKPYFSYGGQLEYEERLHDKACVWQASLTLNSEVKKVVVKFVKRYGKVLHERLAEKNMAPHVYAIEDLSGGWTAVIMDKVNGRTLLDISKKEVKEEVKEKFLRFRTELKTALSEGFVHGDLRPQNIMHEDGKFCIVDFDWAGKNGEEAYPNCINMEVKEWHPDVKPGGLIKLEHDLHVLDYNAKLLGV